MSLIRQLIFAWTLMLTLKNLMSAIADVGDIYTDIGFETLAELDADDAAALADTDSDIGAAAVIIAQDHQAVGAAIADTGTYYSYGY